MQNNNMAAADELYLAFCLQDLRFIWQWRFMSRSSG